MLVHTLKPDILKVVGTNDSKRYLKTHHSRVTTFHYYMVLYLGI